MERNEFIKSLGLGVALICTGSCLSSCGGSKSNDPSPTPGGGGGGGGGGTVGTKVNVDLNSQLTSVGSFVSTGGVLFVRLAAGNSTSSFVATQAVCPHQGGTLNWVQASNLIQCSLHSSQYSSSGAVLAQPNDGGATTALKVYATSITGTVLTATIS
ncbi:Rieske 2Fe-2S domain-containing protein [Pedobacter boryungensis]|uniref:Rieske 2Fe-2S domain-containing protein n=1 Tax=Pedobacter boryungensis TaxID=869962 RepID=A0ABX2DD90_9SPHI|nr:Rieske 2Fe-2S domain-containing protein [Pedobacter boryungensis]NQX31920.1 Rieske 2Fe-2S domain-containing protein [Pedobacter boryungensis]